MLGAFILPATAPNGGKANKVVGPTLTQQDGGLLHGGRAPGPPTNQSREPPSAGHRPLLSGAFLCLPRRR